MNSGHGDGPRVIHAAHLTVEDPQTKALLVRALDRCVELERENAALTKEAERWKRRAFEKQRDRRQCLRLIAWLTSNLQHLRGREAAPFDMNARGLSGQRITKHADPSAAFAGLPE